MSQISTEHPTLVAAEAAPRLVSQVERVFLGKPEVIRLATACLMARGHLLIEDVPGVGKTTLARALARSAGGVFRRIQFTSDLLPSDILGVTVYEQDRGEFAFKPGPIFANIVLADEINRATPRTQSALLEAMSDGQVSAEDETRKLPQPFMVLATQNPQEQYGTYPLPESQMDRFLLRIRVGYPDAASEGRIVAGGWREVDPDRLESVVSLAEITALQDRADEVRVDPSLIQYSMRVVAETRQHHGLSLGVSTRGAMAWVQAARAWALLDGRTYCVPDDLKTLALPCLAHRVVLGSHHESVGKTRSESERLISEILARVQVPD
ncbi:MAG: MoxR family ATPase [bacterium]